MRKILDLIPQTGEASWSILVEKALAHGMGKATVSRHLKRLVKLGILERRVDSSTYPPKVYYKRRSLKEERLYMPYEVATGLFGEPPSRGSSIDEVENWIKAQLRLLLAKIIFEVSPPPILFRNAPDDEIEAFTRENFLKGNEDLLEQMTQLHVLFSKITAFNEEKLQRINEAMLLEYYNMFDEALKPYNLSIDKIISMVKEGRMPPLKPLFPMKFSFTSPEKSQSKRGPEDITSNTS